jgi:hypothetical protein
LGSWRSFGAEAALGALGAGVAAKARGRRFRGGFGWRVALAPALELGAGIAADRHG